MNGPRAPRRTSHARLIIGLVAGCCALVLADGAIGGYSLWQRHEAARRHSLEQATLATYHRMGPPTGFTEQRGSPRLKDTTWLTATWTAPSRPDDPVNDPVNTTAAWLDEHTKDISPSDDDVRSAYSEGDPFFIDDPKAQNIQVTLSSKGSTYRIDVSMFL